MIRIANFILDEKFIDGLIEYHDYVGTDCVHDYYLIANKNTGEFKYIKKYPQRIIVIGPSVALDTAARYDAIFLHSLYTFPVNLIPRIENKVKLFWFSWGYDIYSSPYGSPLIKLNLYHPLTRRYVIRDFKYQFIYLLKIINSYRKKIDRYHYIKAVQRVDYYSGVIPEEFNLLKEQVGGFNAKRVDYTYCNLQFFSKKERVMNNNKNIIIGNSTSYEINHLDVFHQLKNLDLAGRKIYVPLSYSPNPRYVKTLIQEGTRLFGDKFVPITKYMPFNEYMSIFNKCGFAIYGVERQMAMGNIVLCLENGCKVFLYSSSLVYKHYNDLGAKVFSIETDLLQSDALVNLSDSDIQNNKEFIYNSMKEDVLVNKLLKIYDIIEKN